jgi:hypothetical protein
MRQGVPGMRTSMPRNGLKARRPLTAGSVSWRATVVAGICAGVIATAVQLILWWIAHYPLPETLYRDARLTAAMVMGPDVLPPPATFELDIMLVATVLHFALSIIYGFVFVHVMRVLALNVGASLLGRAAGILAGLPFGLLLYVVNMYGFTFLFPWFSLVRDWITVVAHLVFGLVLARTYSALVAERSG